MVLPLKRSMDMARNIPHHMSSSVTFNQFQSKIRYPNICQHRNGIPFAFKNAHIERIDFRERLGACPRIEAATREIHFESDFSII